MNETPDVTRQHFSTNQESRILTILPLTTLLFIASSLSILFNQPAKMSGRLSQFVKFYNANFERRPIPTLMITNSTLNTLADILAQSSQIYVSFPFHISTNTSSQRQMLNHHTIPRGHYDSQCSELLWDHLLGNG
jgi:hypothetical protein